MTIHAKGVLLILFVTSCLSSSGCLPRSVAVSPAVEGAVIDNRTKCPVERASVYLRERPDSRAITDSDGRFTLTARTGLRMISLLGDPICSGMLVVEKAGCHSKEVQVRVMNNQVAQITVELIAKPDSLP
jgi:hypothetical protein